MVLVDVARGIERTEAQYAVAALCCLTALTYPFTTLQNWFAGLLLISAAGATGPAAADATSAGIRRAERMLTMDVLSSHETMVFEFCGAGRNLAAEGVYVVHERLYLRPDADTGLQTSLQSRPGQRQPAANIFSWRFWNGRFYASDAMICAIGISSTSPGTGSGSVQAIARWSVCQIFDEHSHQV